jgi:hypothetical protein
LHLDYHNRLWFNGGEGKGGDIGEDILTKFMFGSKERRGGNMRYFKTNLLFYPSNFITFI